MDSPYLAYFADLCTGTPIDVLPLQGLEFDDYIGKPGSLSATLPVPNRRMARRVRDLVEGRTAVYLERGDQVCWGGIVWTLTPAMDEQGMVTVALQAATFDSYAGRRHIRRNLTYTDTDDLTIVRGLWEHIQEMPGGDIGVGFAPAPPGTRRTVTYLDGDETPVEEAIAQLAAMEPGFEYLVSVYRDPATGRRAQRLLFGVPRIDVGEGTTVLDLPGDILTYSFPRDATRGGTTARARGGTPEGAQRPVISDEHVAQALIGAGFPRLDTTSDHSNVTDKATLDALARTELAALGGPVVIPAVRVRLDADTTPSLLGTTVRLRIHDVWFSEGLDASYRVIGVKVTAPERGRAETAELFLEGMEGP
ncbi:hypothetical protein [Streptomyces aureocirculatus]|uniref:hypothetical protein n=1 Tax=Streptomyces aureocirculatus TaxID=67275 RepID=UPI0004C643B6|nr:hypothetical protein [Streptomyces aureocirculatus]